MAKNNNDKPKTTGVKRAFIGLIMLSVVASIYLTSGMIYLGTEDLFSKLLTVPSVAFATGVVIYAFIKASK